MEDDENKSDPEPSDESEYEEYDDSEEETEQRLKPVFVRKYETTLIFGSFEL